MRIARGGEQNAIPAIRASSWHSAARLISTHIGQEPILISDLALGSWKSNVVAHEFMAQLGARLDLGHTFTRPDPQHHVMPEYVGAIDVAIDLESSGNRTIRNALDLAEQVLSASTIGQKRFVFAVILPMFNMALELEDILLLYFLNQGFSKCGNRIVLLSIGSEPTFRFDLLNIAWLGVKNEMPQPDEVQTNNICLPPGIISNDLMKAVLSEPDIIHGENLVKLENDHALIRPETRKRPSENASWLSRIENRLSPDLDYVRVFAMFYSPDNEVDAEFLRDQGWKYLGEGSTGLALRCLSRASQAARSASDRGILAAELQGIRIATQRYREAALDAEPSPLFSVPLRSFLLEAKGWGLAMSGRPERAVGYLARAVDILPPAWNDERYLYLQNIYALSLFRSGRLSEALSIEKRIGQALTARMPGYFHLFFINRLNTARLYRASGQLQDADRSYREAFSTSDGTKSESDLIYENICLASISSEVAAQTYWFRAAVHFAACEVPEALAPRLLLALIGPDFLKYAPSELVEEVAKRLLGQLRLYPNFVMLTAGQSEQSPCFLRSSCLKHELQPSTTAIAGDQWTVFATEGGSLPANFDGSMHRELRRLLWAIIKAHCPRARYLRTTTIFVDDHLGTGMPLTFKAAYEACLRLGVPHMLSAEREIAVIKSREAELIVRPGDAVREVYSDGEETTVRFKRYLPSELLDTEESRILREIDGSSGITDLSNGTSSLSAPPLVTTLRKMERKRIVALELPEIP